MTFFARPNLSDEQFKQLAGTTLTLSGQTQIKTVTGLTLANNSVGTAYPNIIITAENADFEVNSVLTYDGLGKIKLTPASAVGGDPIYPSTCKSPASVSLCGISAGFILTGKTLSNILETLLVPTLQPTAVQPSFSFDLSPSTTIFEVGTIIPTLSSVNANFSKGSVTPQYCGTPNCRSGAALAYNYTVFGSPVSSPTSNITLGSNCKINAGNNIVSGYVAYGTGPTILDSAGNTATGPTVTPNPLSAGNTGAVSKTLTGIYPYFYGKIASGGAPSGGNRPTPATISTCITAGCGKTVLCSMNDITITWGSTIDDYIWFATPVESTTKTKWANTVVTVDNGSIGGAVSAGGNLFPDFVSVSPTSTIWANVGSSPHAYKVYISNYQVLASNPYLLKNS